jgi:hypothetical protein
METIPLESILVPLSAVLGLSLVVERILEIAKNILERLIGSNEGRMLPEIKHADEIINGLTEKYERAKLEEDFEAGSSKTKKSGVADEQEPDERVLAYRVYVEAATDPDDGSTLRIFILQLLGFAAGIVLAHYSGVQLFNSFLKTLGNHSLMPAWVDFLFTGLLIGGGSGPLHVLIKFVQDRKIDLPEDEAEKELDQLKAPVKVIQAPKSEVHSDIWEDIPYAGGVDRDKLQDVHLRKKNPDLVVYHHTAMHSDSTFQDLVRVIKDKKWLTGYNCVILKDGSIKPYCRWDRYGNHAVGYNAHSLGLAFHGNFENNPDVPFSNPDGRYGISRPTELQLKAGAQVVALWTYLYSIPLDFKKSIIPHNQISDKACPGNLFPYDEFKNLISFYHDEWDKSGLAKQKISEFKLKPYLYI